MLMKPGFLRSSQYVLLEIHLSLWLASTVFLEKNIQDKLMQDFQFCEAVTGKKIFNSDDFLAVVFMRFI